MFSRQSRHRCAPEGDELNHNGSRTARQVPKKDDRRQWPTGFRRVALDGLSHQQVLDAAERVFAELGYDQTTPTAVRGCLGDGIEGRLARVLGGSVPRLRVSGARIRTWAHRGRESTPKST